jgi:predicted  nucleic acid-binding Zn-ribbon protein
MTEHQELAPVTQPGEPTSEPRTGWQRLIEELQRERDELRVRLHLARKEVAEELEKIDQRIEELKTRTRAASDEADHAMDDIEGAARKLWDEIRAGFDRVRKSFTDGNPS